MRPAGKTWGMALLFALGSLAKADPPAPYETTITVPEVEVRAGPSPQFYATMKLRQGERVRVVEQRDGGWLAVEPPPGSFNWINERFIERATPTSSTGVVVSENPIQTRIGSQLSNTEPNALGVKVPRGTQIVILSNRAAYSGEGGWLPIQPPPKELRYIPADAAKTMAPVQSSSAAPPAAAGAPADPLWRKQSKRRRLITKRKPSGYTSSSRCRRRITTCKCSATTRFIFCARGTTTTIPWPVRRATFPIRAIPAITRTHKEHRTLPLLQLRPSADVHLFSRRAAAPGGSNSAKRRSSGCRHRGRSMERRRVAANHWMHY